MADDKFNQIILDELKKLNKSQSELSSSVTEMNTEFKLHKQESNHRWEKIAELDAQQNDLLSKHNDLLAEHRKTGLAQMEANDLARQDLEFRMNEKHEFLQKQVFDLRDQVDTPRKFWKTLRTVAIYFTSIGGAVAMLYGLFMWLSR